MSSYWLMRSEPDVYSIEDLRSDKVTNWEGVRNYKARNLMREMDVGDLALFYHSNAKPPGVAGIARIVKEAYPDHFSWNPASRYFDPKSTPDDPRWFMVDVEFVERFPVLVSLHKLKETEGLEEMVVTKPTRFSVQPVTPEEFEIVVEMGRRGH